jgi:hypothetical protein
MDMDKFLPSNIYSVSANSAYISFSTSCKSPVDYSYNPMFSHMGRFADQLSLLPLWFIAAGSEMP